MSDLPREIVVALDLNDPSEEGANRQRALIRFAKQLERVTQRSAQFYFAVERSAAKTVDEKELMRGLQERIQQISMDEPLNLKTISGHVSEALIQFARSDDFRVELYLVGMRKLDSLRRFYFGSVTEELVRHSRRPVAIIGPNAEMPWARDAKLNLPLRFLVSTDLTRSSRPAEHYALSLASRSKASVCLIHNTWETYRVMEDSAIQSGMVPIDFSESLEEISRDARTALEAKANFFRKHGVACDFIIDEQAHSASQSIVSRQGDGFSLVVMGTRARNRLMTAFLGSTLRDTLLAASLPILVVRA